MVAITWEGRLGTFPPTDDPLFLDCDWMRVPLANPRLDDNGPLSVRGGGRFIPSTSWEAVWHGLAEWFGVEEARMEKVLPIGPSPSHSPEPHPEPQPQPKHNHEPTPVLI